MLFLFIIFLLFVIAMIYEFIGNHLSTPEDRRHTFKAMLSIIIRVLIILIIPSVIIIASGSLPSVMTWVLNDDHIFNIMIAPIIICLLDMLILNILAECNSSGTDSEFEIKFSIRIYVYLLLSLVFFNHIIFHLNKL